jgi:GNAT superfamily N-acetyltransferase
MSDIPKETPPVADTASAPKDDAPPAPASRDLTPAGRSALSGADVPTKPEPAESLPGQDFTDAKGRPLSFRDYANGDSHYLRAFDQDKLAEAGKLEPTPSDSIAHANLHFERDRDGRVDRARLQDINTAEAYRKAGVGGFLLERSESFASKNGAREIYGSPESEAARDWFVARGYQVRAHGTEIYRTLRL